MRNVEVILEALYVLDISYEDFESSLQFTPGKLIRLREGNADDFTKVELESIAQGYAARFKDVGYHFVSNTLFDETFVTKDAIKITD